MNEISGKLYFYCTNKTERRKNDKKERKNNKRNKYNIQPK